MTGGREGEQERETDRQGRGVRERERERGPHKLLAAELNSAKIVRNRLIEGEGKVFWGVFKERDALSRLMRR